MTEADWLEIAAEIEARWPHADLSAATIAAWYSDVADQEPGPVLDALRSFSRDGREHAPTGGMLRRRAAELAAPRRDWAEGYRLACSCPFSFSAEPPDDPAPALAWLTERDPVAAETVRRFGIEAWALRLLEDEGVHRAQFRGIYEQAAVSAVEAERYAGLPTFDRGRLEAPRRLSALAALPERTGDGAE